MPQQNNPSVLAYFGRRDSYEPVSRYIYVMLGEYHDSGFIGVGYNQSIAITNLIYSCYNRRFGCMHTWSRRLNMRARALGVMPTSHYIFDTVYEVGETLSRFIYLHRSQINAGLPATRDFWESMVSIPRSDSAAHRRAAAIGLLQRYD